VGACITEMLIFGDKAKSYSEKTAEIIDQEVEQLTKEATSRAEAEALIEKETLEEKDVDAVLKGATMPSAVKLH